MTEDNKNNEMEKNQEGIQENTQENEKKEILENIQQIAQPTEEESLPPRGDKAKFA